MMSDTDHSKEKIARNTFINGADLFVSILVSFLVLPILVSRLGDEVFGIYSLLLVFSVNGFLSFLDFGFEGALVKYLAEWDTKKNYSKFGEYFWNGILFYSTIGLIIMVLIILGINLLDRLPFEVSKGLQDLTKAVFFAYSFQMPLQFMSLGLGSTLKSVQRFGVLKGINVGYLVVNFFLIVFFLYEKQDLYNFIWLQNVLYLFRCGIEFYFSSKLLPRNRRFTFKINLQIVYEIFGYAKYLFISKIIGFVYNQTDKLLISFFLPVAQLTYYSIAIKVPNLMSALSSVINSTITPAASSFKASNNKYHLKQLFMKGTRFGFLLILPCVIIGIFLIKPFLGLWVGDKYTHLYFLSIILFGQFFFTQLISVGSTMIVGSGDVKQFIPYSLFGAVSNLIISVVLMSSYGILGLVIGTTTSYMLFSIPYLVKLLRLYEIDLTNFLIKLRNPTYALILLAVGCYLVTQFFNIQSIIAFVTTGSIILSLYLSAIYFMVLEKKEKKLIQNLILNLNHKR